MTPNVAIIVLGRHRPVGHELTSGQEHIVHFWKIMLDCIGGWVWLRRRQWQVV
jgi:hypothetical protein